MEPQSEEQTEQIPTKDKMDQLIDHAKALIDTAKTFVTKPVGRKHGRKQSTASPVETDVKLKALDVLHRVTINKLATLHVEMDGRAEQAMLTQVLQNAGKSCVKCVQKYLAVLGSSTPTIDKIIV